MKNRYLEKFDRLLRIRIKGRNVHNYLKRLMNMKIRFIKVIPKSYKEIEVILKYSEYQKLLQFKSIYEIEVVKKMGFLRVKEAFWKNYILLFFLSLGLIGIIFLSKIIFSIEVIHQDAEIREILSEELTKYGLKKYGLKKSYEELEKIENNILNDYKDRLEWIEIISYGTKYMVRVEERKIANQDKTVQYQNIVSKKNAVIVEINAKSGEKVKDVNTYVKKGEVVISGSITLPDNTKIWKMAEGDVYGEVWYQVDVDYPFVYQESNFTGRSKIVYALHFLGKRFSFFDFKEYHSISRKDKVLFASNFLNIQFVKEIQYEVNIMDEVYTEDIVRNKAIDYIKNKLKKDNPDIMNIEEVRILSTSSDEDSIRFKLFVRVVEDIGEVSIIDKDTENLPQ